MVDQPTPDEMPGARVEVGRRVTSLELFFDLVFVLALTQMTAFLRGDPSWVRLLEAVAILMVLWMAWSGYVWLGNTAGPDDGTIRLVLLTAMCALLVVSLAVPHAFGRDGVVFGVACSFVVGLHIVAYVVLARGDPHFVERCSPRGDDLAGVGRACTRQPRT